MVQGRVKIGDFGLARITRAPLRPLSDNGIVVTIWCCSDGTPAQSSHPPKCRWSMPKARDH